MTTQPKTIYLKDYQPPAYWVETVDLTFHLEETKTLVKSHVTFKRNENVANANTPLVLLGTKLELKNLSLEGRSLSQSEYILDQETLTIPHVPDKFSLQIETEIHPETNSELTGLFRSSGLFCTQCESEGFRRMTYYPDRPDVMAKFTTKIIADKRRYPVLLSNGNCVETGDSENNPNYHWVKWEDPFKKPSYLFALVAGDLIAVEDNFVTCSGRLITLKLYVERENLDKSRYAMEALKKAMKWDEVTYGREYDLDIYMIVAVNDFNMGAMENKGLNLFNSKYVLASPETATDSDYYHIDAVVGHEYFHNWTGNRITCRDWFQLSLKEGLTVFREHHFSSEINKSSVSLIEDARLIRSRQFAEDAGPMSHAVRPESYMEINNFYTMTVYEKGAEVIRMLKTLLGWENFRKGMDIYFERHDGQAATTDDFVAAMEAASKKDLTQFRLWYSQAGTPEIEVQEVYDAAKKTYDLKLKQSCPSTPGQITKEAFHIPIAIGLLDKNGKDILPKTQVLELREAEQVFHFSNITERPVLSLLREFSAPVKVKTSLSDEQLAFLLAHDSDDFNRWDAGHKLTERVLLRLMEAYKSGQQLKLESVWLEAYRLFWKADVTPDFKAQIFSFPTTNELIESVAIADIDAIMAARTFLKDNFAKSFTTELLNAYQNYLTPGRYVYSASDAAKRSFKNLCLHYLMLLKEDKTVLNICIKQYHEANNMTDKLGALSALTQKDCLESKEALADFYVRWQHEPLVVNKWFTVQAISESENTLENVKALINHPAFEITNPNKVYALIGAFSSSNPVRFHEKSGKGYAFLREIVLKLDRLNPQVAARMINPFTRWKKFDVERQNKMKAELEKIKAESKLSKDIYEVVSKSLAQT